MTSSPPTRARALNESGVEKIRNFQPISHNKTVGVIENVDFQGFWTLRLRHLMKWGHHYYIVLFSPLSPFQWPQNMWPWMTLTGYLMLNSVFALVWLADTAQLRKIIAWKLIKIDTYCQRCKSSAETPVSGNIRFVRIFGRVLYRKKTLNDSGFAP